MSPESKQDRAPLAVDPGAIYRFIAANRSALPAEISESLGFSERRLAPSIDYLLEHNLIDRDPESSDRLIAYSPETARLRATVATELKLAEARRELLNLNAQYSAMENSFTEIYREAHRGSDLEHIESGRFVLPLLLNEVANATNSVLTYQTGPGSTADRLEDTIQTDEELRSRGVTRKTILQSARKSHAPTLRMVDALSPLGCEFRMNDSMPNRLVIIDKKVAIIGNRGEGSEHGSGTIIRNPELVGMLSDYFLQVWGSSPEFSTGDAGEKSTLGELSRIELSVLGLLSAGKSDDTIARTLQISVRTCRRYVANILQALGAESRFQAGFNAANFTTSRGQAPKGNRRG